MGWVLGYPQMSSAFVESLSSVMCKNQQIKCLSSIRTQIKEWCMTTIIIKATLVSAIVKIIKSEEWMENPSIYNKILGYPRIMSNNKILWTPL